jgi:hypothetical protein
MQRPRNASLKLAILSGLTAAPLLVNAADLRAPFDIEHTKVLPPKIRNPRVKLLNMDIQERFNGGGLVEPLGQKLNKTVTWNDIINAQKTDLDKTQVQGTLSSLGFSTSDSPGQTSGVVNTFADVRIPIIAIGLSEKWTFAAAIPVMNVDVSASTGFLKSDQGQAFIDDICGTDVVKCNEAKDKLNNAINQKLTNKGYEPIESRTVKGIGDIRVINKVQLADEETYGVAFRGEIGLPTGTAPNANRALDVPTGDGQWDFGAGLTHDLKFTPELTLSTYGQYLAQLPARLERRLPVSATDSISADKELLLRDLGDQLNMGTSVTNFFPKLGLTLGVGYNFQFQNSTSYEDGALESFRYRLLENETPIQALHSAVVVAGFSTVEWFKAKSFALPFQANVVYSKPFAGRNATTNSTLAAEVVLFF